MIENNPQLDPGAVDGTIDADESSDDVVKAIMTLQARFMNAPDGVINVGKRTWRELVMIVDGDEDEGDSTPEPVTTSTVSVTESGQFFFPFTQLPQKNWTEDIRRFGAGRSNGKRAHAACDLYFPVGTTIHAITSGVVTLGPYLFYNDTYALEVDHGSFLARYGEIQKSTLVHVGDHVTAGQPLAKVGKLTGMTNSMLHLELYDKSASGSLTVKNSQTKRTADGKPFWRRKDLIDPTPKLNQWKNNLPS
jgi:murein DD-endopeptidase MepM/ murein hydrolase activator NlpD